MSGGIHLRSLATGQHSSEESSQQWRNVRDTMSNLTGRGIEPQTSCTDSVRLATELTGRLHREFNISKQIFIILEVLYTEARNERWGSKVYESTAPEADTLSTRPFGSYPNFSAVFCGE